MTKPLPNRDVAARATRKGRARLSAVEQKALASIEDENLKKVLGELLLSTRDTQDNFQEIEQWFPVQPDDIARRYENQSEADESQFWLKWLRKGKKRAAAKIRAYYESFAFKTHTLSLKVQGQDPTWPGDPEHEDATRQAEIRIFASDESESSGVFIIVSNGARYLLRREAGGGSNSDWLQVNSKRQLPGGSLVKGCLITADGVDLPRILQVGEDGRLLVADSTAERGLKWKTPEEVGLKGLEGRWAGLHYTWLTNTEVSDPGSGKAKRSNTNSALRISETDKDGNNVAAFLAAWDDSTTLTNRGTIVVRQVGSPKRFRILKITGALTDEGAWDSIPTELLAEGEALENEKEVAIEWVRTGDQGATGEKGAEGAKGVEGAKGAEGRSAGFKYTYSTNTESSDPGAGKLKFNNATLSEATLLRISETDGDGNSIAAFLATIDDSTSTVKGTLTLRKVGEPAKFATFQTSGVLNDNGTWDSLTVAHVASNGLVNNDVVTLEYSRTGDKGEKGEKGETGTKGEVGGAIETDSVASSAAGTGTLEWEHAFSESSKVQGVLVLIVANGSAADEVNAVTMSGVALEELSGSPFGHTAGGLQKGTIYAYFLPEWLIPEVSGGFMKMTVTGATTKRAVSIAVKADAPLRVEGTATLDSAGTTEPKVDVPEGRRAEKITYAALHSGDDSPTTIAGAGSTKVVEHDFGTQSAAWFTQSAHFGGNSNRISATQLFDEAGMFGVTIARVKDFGIVTALPTRVGRGDRCTFVADSANGVLWELEYDGEGAKPWKKIGGPPLTSGPLSAESKTNTEISGTGAPSIVAPLTMDFGGTFGAKWMQQRSIASGTMLLRLVVNGVVKLETAAIANSQFGTIPSLASIVGPQSVTKGQTINMGYSTTAGEASFVQMTLVVDPIRVG